MKTLFRFVGACSWSRGRCLPVRCLVSGTRVEAAVSEPYAQLAGLPYLKVVKREYRRGVFVPTKRPPSNCLAHAQIHRSCGKTKVASSPDEHNKSFQLTVRSHIRHGPLPDGKVFAAAMVDSERTWMNDSGRIWRGCWARQKLSLPTPCTDMRAMANRLLRARPFQLHCLGRGRCGGALILGGRRVTIRFTRELGSYTTEAEAPKLEIAGKGAHIVIAGMRFDTESSESSTTNRALFGQAENFHRAGGHRRTRYLGRFDPAEGTELRREHSGNGEFIDIVAKDRYPGCDRRGNQLRAAHLIFRLSVACAQRGATATCNGDCIPTRSDGGNKNPVEGSNRWRLRR